MKRPFTFGPFTIQRWNNFQLMIVFLNIWWMAPLLHLADMKRLKEIIILENDSKKQKVGSLLRKLEVPPETSRKADSVKYTTGELNEGK